MEPNIKKVYTKCGYCGKYKVCSFVYNAHPFVYTWECKDCSCSHLTMFTSEEDLNAAMEFSIAHGCKDVYVDYKANGEEYYCLKRIRKSV